MKIGISELFTHWIIKFLPLILNPRRVKIVWSR